MLQFGDLTSYLPVARKVATAQPPEHQYRQVQSRQPSFSSTSRFWTRQPVLPDQLAADRPVNTSPSVLSISMWHLATLPRWSMTR